MSSPKFDYSNKIQLPTYQAASVGILVLLIAGILKLLVITKAMETPDPILFWVIGGAGVLFFAMMNSVVSLAATDMNKYWFYSTASYVALAVSCALMAFVFSGVAINDAGSFRWIFTVLTFGYLFFLSLMRFLRKIVQMAQAEDKRWEDRVK